MLDGITWEKVLPVSVLIICISVAYFIYKRAAPGQVPEWTALVRTLMSEFRLSGPSPRGQLMNILMLVFAFLLALGIISPSILDNFGVIQDDSFGSEILGAILFFLVLLVSVVFLYINETEHNRRQNDREEEREAND